MKTEDNDYEYEYTKFPKCPYCDDEHIDCWEWGCEEDNFNVNCHSCGKEFNLEIDVNVTYSTFSMEEAKE